MARARVRVASSLKATEDSGFYPQHSVVHRKVLPRGEHWRIVKHNIFEEFLMMFPHVLLILTRRIHN